MVYFHTDSVDITQKFEATKKRRKFVVKFNFNKVGGTKLLLFIQISNSKFLIQSNEKKNINLSVEEK